MRRLGLPGLALLVGLGLCPEISAQALPGTAGHRLQILHAAAGDLPGRHRALARIDGRVLVVEGSLAELADIARHPATDAIELSAPLRLALSEALPAVSVPAKWIDRGDGGGQGVVIGIVDTGIDWAHPDFRGTDGQTRVAWLMDVSLPARAQATPDLAEFDAAIWSQAELAAAIDDPDSIASRDRVGHGTHVAGIAAARAADTSLAADGVAPDATLIAVRASRDDTFSLEEADVLLGVDFVLNRATARGSPLVINLSLGGHSGPHDGSSLFERALEDRFSGQPGRVLVTAVGNDGDRDVHVSGPLGSVAVPIRVSETAGEGFAMIEVWYTIEDRPVVGPGTTTTAWLEGPDGRRTEPAALGQSVREISPTDGILALTHSAGGEGLAQVTVFLQTPEGGGLLPGDYTVHLSGGEGCFDGWVVSAGPFGARFVQQLDTDVRLTVPATARGAIAIGAMITRNQWPSLSGPMHAPLTLGAPADFSATGPTLDGRPRPDALAPGLVVASTMSRDANPASSAASLYQLSVERGFDPVLPDGQHAVASGTSMAAPFATGAAALLLARDPTLTSEQVGGLLRSTTRNDGAPWDPRRGFGQLDIGRAQDAQESSAQSALSVDASRVSVTRDVLGPKSTAYVVVSAAGQDGLPLRTPWTPEVEIVADKGEAWVGQAYLRDETSWYIPVTAGTAAGEGRVRVRVNGIELDQAPRVRFGARSDTGHDGAVIAGTGCHAVSRARTKWTSWRRR